MDNETGRGGKNPPGSETSCRSRGAGGKLSASELKRQNRLRDLESGGPLDVDASGDAIHYFLDGEDETVVAEPISAARPEPTIVERPSSRAPLANPKEAVRTDDDLFAEAFEFAIYLNNLRRRRESSSEAAD